MRRTFQVIKKNTKNTDKKIKVLDNISQYYEDLRSYSLGNQTAFMYPLGLDMFIKKGTVAWIVAWSDYSINSNSNFKLIPNVDINLNYENIIPRAIHHEITVLLANMILSMEVQSC